LSSEIESLMRKVLIPLAIIVGFWLASCEREPISTSPSIKLSFSADTVVFDTVFTTIGSATRYFKVYNRSKSDIEISSVRLAGGSGSVYRMNVDGEATAHAKNVLLRSRDSLFVFVEVTVNPTNDNSPLFIADSIVFVTNGNIQDVKLLAWGQDVHLLNEHVISESKTFIADKPYLVYNYLYVTPEGELNIEAGVKMHFHNQAQFVVSGSLKVNGSPDNPVVMEGDRLEPFYRDKAGQWGGIWLTAGSYSNIIDWAIIKNAIIGVRVDTVAAEGLTTLRIHNTQVVNMSSAALYALGATVEAGNCLFANAGQIAVALTLGGRYRFYHCTIANYWGQYIQRKGPALLLNNYYTYRLYENGPILVEPRDLEEAYFGNCIVYGSRSQEFQVDNLYLGSPVNALMNYYFENSIIRVGSGFNITDENHFKNVINENPKFKDSFKGNFELDTLSPAKDFGLFNIATLFPFDLKNISRLNDLGPDIGAFERVEKIKSLMH
jgi:hypothetical protein